MVTSLLDYDQTGAVEENRMNKSFLNVENRRDALTSSKLPESNETSLNSAREMENPIILGDTGRLVRTSAK